MKNILTLFTVLIFLNSCTEGMKKKTPQGVVINSVDQKGLVVDKNLKTFTLTVRTKNDIVEISPKREVFDYLNVNDTIK